MEGSTVSTNDGLFFMDIDSYMSNFSMTNVNQDTSTWSPSYFLSLSRDAEGEFEHLLTVTNTHNTA